MFNSFHYIQLINIYLEASNNLFKKNLILLVKKIVELNFQFKADYSCKEIPSIKKGERGSKVAKYYQ